MLRSNEYTWILECYGSVLFWDWVIWKVWVRSGQVRSGVSAGLRPRAKVAYSLSRGLHQCEGHAVSVLVVATWRNNERRPFRSINRWRTLMVGGRGRGWWNFSWFPCCSNCGRGWTRPNTFPVIFGYVFLLYLHPLLVFGSVDNASVWQRFSLFLQFPCGGHFFPCAHFPYWAHWFKTHFALERLRGQEDLYIKNACHFTFHVHFHILPYTM
jgi:hypothetical protein